MIASHNVLSLAILSSIFDARFRWESPTQQCRLVANVVRYHASRIPNSCLPLMQRDSRDRQHGFLEYLAQGFDTCWPTEQIHVVQKRAQLFSLHQMRGNFFEDALDALDGEQQRHEEISLLAALSLCDGVLLSRIIVPRVTGRPSVRHPHKWQQCPLRPAPAPTGTTSLPVNMVVRPDPINTWDGGGWIRVRCCAKHVTDEVCPRPRGQSTLERRTLRFEHFTELFRQLPRYETWTLWKWRWPSGGTKSFLSTKSRRNISCSEALRMARSEGHVLQAWTRFLLLLGPLRSICGKIDDQVVQFCTSRSCTFHGGRHGLPVSFQRLRRKKNNARCLPIETMHASSKNSWDTHNNDVLYPSPIDATQTSH